ncbi:MAG: hypothetical protein IJT02_03560 [Synergistaceae bacterium]|nr:hypothetical protein [Synergistaceae bacterium]
MLESSTLTVTKEGTASNADSSSASSKAVALRTAEIISDNCGCRINVMNKAAGQTLGRQFEVLVSEFLRNTFLRLDSIRPGKWGITCSGAEVSSFAQYEHLAELGKLISRNAQLAAVLGNDYVIAPDIVIYRERYSNEELNSHEQLVDGSSACASDIRETSGRAPILHASISAKYTIRSDRAQNSRTEALNLIRNRKGHLPHIVVVTAEPMPGRLASIALGTGDIDCVYHFALYELEQAVNECASDDSAEMLHTLIDGKRLKDISDLPLDLTV